MPAAAAHSDAPILGNIAVVVIPKAADFDLADFAGRQAAVAVDDGDVVIGERPADRAMPSRFAGDRRDPASLA
jgi:hypothetical protein